MVAPIAVDMLDFNRNLMRHRMPFGPSATAAALTQSTRQIFPQERSRLHRKILARFEKLRSHTKPKLLLAAEGAESRRAFLDSISTSRITVSTKLLWIHALIVRALYAIRMALYAKLDYRYKCNRRGDLVCFNGDYCTYIKVYFRFLTSDVVSGN